MAMIGGDGPVEPAGPSAPSWYAADNGFSSAAAMARAHRPIVALARRVFGAASGNVVDLGCGNGALVREISEACPKIMPFGIDADAGRIEHARKLLPRFAANFFTGDFFEMDEPWLNGRRYALAILMPGRLLEARPEEALRLRRRLAAQCDRVLVYAYSDWLARYDSLTELARSVGLIVDDAEPGSRAALAICDQVREA